MSRSLLLALLLLSAAAQAAEPEAPQPSETEAPMTEVSGDTRFRAPGRSRYLFGHSGMMLRAGEGFFSQKELLYSMASIGITDHVTVTLGSALPLWLAGPQGMNVVGGLKVGGSLSERVHLAAGAELVVLPFLGSGMGLVYGAFTYGTPDAHVTLGAGVTPSFYTNQLVAPGGGVVTLSGNLRLSRHFALVSENWMFVPSYILVDPFIGTGALRIMGEHWSVDVGVVRVPGNRFLPWLDLALHWG